MCAAIFILYVFVRGDVLSLHEKGSRAGRQRLPLMTLGAIFGHINNERWGYYTNLI
jgi:hypothetical protein